MTPEELDEAIGTGDVERVLAVLAGATEAERRAAAGVPGRWGERVAEHWRRRQAGEEPLIPAERFSGVGDCISMAVVGTAGGVELHHTFHVDYERVARVLADRRPAWLTRWSEQALRRHPPVWRLVRLLERQGLIPRPDPELYTLGLISSPHPEGAVGKLRDDPELLEEAVWRIFEFEGNREASLALCDKYGGADASWTTALVRLSGDERLSRERLLDASLDALARDFAQFRAGWFSRFHEALSPTLDEREVRLPRYLGLLSSRIPPTVSFALKALALLERAGRLPGEALLDHVAPALVAREKGTVSQALGLLDRAAKREPALAPRAAEVAAEALLHEAPDVQGAALDLIERHAPDLYPALRSLLAERVGDVAASQRPRLEALLGAAAGEQGSQPDAEAELSALVARAARVPLHWRELSGLETVLEGIGGAGLVAPAIDLPFHAVPRLDPNTAVHPIQTLDELIEVFSTVIETCEPPDQIERVLDGVSRLCAERPADFDRRTGPLRKRASRLLRRPDWSYTFAGWLPQDLPALVLAWITGEAAPMRRGPEPDLDSFSGLRLWEVAARAARREARPLLALPTHADGWIDPRVLVERIRSAPGWDMSDAVQSLLRVAPDHRHAAREAAPGLTGELGDALRHALGADGVAPGPAAPLWIAASRARSPLADDPAVEARHPGLGPDAGRAARLKLHVQHETSVYEGQTYHYFPVRVDIEPAVPEAVGADLPTVLHHVASTQEIPGRRWTATIWPAGRHAWFGRGVEAVGGNIDWPEAEWPNRVYLEALLEADTPLCEMGRALLGIGLGAKEPGESGLSVDALIAAVRDGRVDGARLGDALAALGTTGLTKGARWAKTLATVARASSLHREVVRDALEGLIAAGPEMRPADLGAVLALLHELCVESAAGVRDERARAFLGGVRGGKSGASAKALLQLTEGDRKPHIAAATAEALAGRLERAERWAGFAAPLS